MRIDGSNPTPSAVSRPEVREVKPAPAVHQAAPEVKDHVDTHQQQKPEVAPTNVLVKCIREMLWFTSLSMKPVDA